MNTILHIISSARGDQSYSKGLSTAIINRLLEQIQTDTLITRDLAQSPPPFADKISIHEFYKHPGLYDKQSHQLLSYANTIVEELKQADYIVIGTPMFNLGISAPLKAWLDQLIRAGVTYIFDEQGNRIGKFKDKKVYLAIASGGKSTSHAPDYLESYVKDVLKIYTGITNIRTYRVEDTVAEGFTADYDQILKDFT
ncbi:NAD(P)H-dependent oxidoreductase [Chryseobacterium sp.]|uniref:FMN-dependent NADH-azoreductase n=1 Tax=Chryseobacterium sp. TaxID=1871047 RepID=UPI00333E447F